MSKPVSPASPLIALGDSITAAGPWSQAFPGHSVLNAGILGNTTVDLLGRLDDLPGLHLGPHGYNLWFERLRAMD